MVRTKYDAVSFLVRTLILIALIIFSFHWIEEAEGKDGYRITDISGDRVTVSVGIIKQQFSTDYASQLNVGDMFPAVDQLKAVGHLTPIILYSLFSILLLWDILIYFKIGKRIKRTSMMRKGIKQSATITGYTNFQPFTYTVQVDKKYRADFLIFKSEQKKYPIGMPVLLYHLGGKKYWVELQRR